MNFDFGFFVFFAAILSEARFTNHSLKSHNKENIKRREFYSNDIKMIINLFDYSINKYI